MLRSLVGSEMCIRDRFCPSVDQSWWKSSRTWYGRLSATPSIVFNTRASTSQQAADKFVCFDSCQCVPADSLMGRDGKQVGSAPRGHEGGLWFSWRSGYALERPPMQHLNGLNLLGG
eukprot:TRINITY_DN29631_c0_g1_i3.p1 TRINITY_DN29631_c0_g1~~TRINITY_DN29631_c0_g1_i3.p1  ORF type:complete len:117 (+),score=13.02 TRINITY_DN29631_c0_g1_i3:89-439(+)